MKRVKTSLICKMCGRIFDGIFERLPVHTLPRKATSCPNSGFLVKDGAKQ
jgi:hypothetical protein